MGTRIDPFGRFTIAWEPSMMEKIKELKPDIIVADVLAHPAFYAASDLGIPSVMNIPAGPYSFY